MIQCTCFALDDEFQSIEYRRERAIEKKTIRFSERSMFNKEQMNVGIIHLNRPHLTLDVVLDFLIFLSSGRSDTSFSHHFFFQTDKRQLQ